MLDIDTGTSLQSLDAQRKAWFNGRTAAGAVALAYLLVVSQRGPPRGFHVKKASQGAGIQSL
jgi:hypothetical protein